MKTILTYVAHRLAEPSTWRGMVALVTAAGVAISPELAEAVIAAGLAGIGVIGVLFPDMRPEA